jgi:hypothetical protein
MDRMTRNPVLPGQVIVNKYRLRSLVPGSENKDPLGADWDPRNSLAIFLPNRGRFPEILKSRWLRCPFFTVEFPVEIRTTPLYLLVPYLAEVLSAAKRPQ